MDVLVATESTSDDRKTLAAVRSLARSGARVIMGGDMKRPAFFSRHCSGRIVYPHPEHGLDRFLDALEEHLKMRHYDVLLPMSDHITIPVAAARERLERHVRTVVPDPTSLERSRDKLKTLAIARRLGIGIPRTELVCGLEQLAGAADKTGLPCVLKPRRGAAGIGVQFIDSREELGAAWDRGVVQHNLVYDTRSRLLQGFLGGEVHDVCVLFRDGEPRAALTQKRVYMLPPRGGIAVLAETTDEPELRDLAIRLLAAMRWHGPAQVEFRIDERNGQPKLMEVNGRFWATLELSILAGVDFPVLACRMAIDGDVEPVFRYRVGQRFRWPIPFAFQRGLSSHLRWSLLRPALRTGSNLSITDPLPHLMAALV
jgi:predicted ATP-grasp superfamily ATP-dependent carboligase